MCQHAVVIEARAPRARWPHRGRAGLPFLLDSNSNTCLRALVGTRESLLGCPRCPPRPWALRRIARQAWWQATRSEMQSASAFHSLQALDAPLQCLANGTQVFPQGVRRRAPPEVGHRIRKACGAFSQRRADLFRAIVRLGMCQYHLFRAIVRLGIQPLISSAERVRARVGVQS